MTLFTWGRCISAAGLELDWKAECDALTMDDWHCLALMVAPHLPQVSEVIGVPRGGVKFANALALTGIEMSEFEHGARTQAGEIVPRLLVDDVWTTGRSMNKWARPGDLGVVAFARGWTPEWVTAVWQLNSELQ